MTRVRIITTIAVLVATESLLFGALLHDEHPEIPILLIAAIAPVRGLSIFAERRYESRG